jgi:hypothetical protein
MMKRSQKYLIFAVWLATLFSACHMDNEVFALQPENGTWSFDFKDCSLSDALNQISRVAGIDILTKGQIDQRRFSKSFQNQTIDQILEDLFRRKSHAIKWLYGDNGLVAIGIWIFEGDLNQDGVYPKNFRNYKTARKKKNLIRKNPENSDNRARSTHKMEPNKDLSSRGRADYGELYSDKSRRAPGSASSSGGGLRRSKVFHENVSSRDGYPNNFTVPSPLQITENQGSGASDDGQHESATGPPAPPVKISNGLEPPPMPPGFSHN